MIRGRALAASLSMLIGALALALGSVPAIAATPACADPHGVTVVVDLTDIGGGVLVGCAGSGGMNGLQALQRAGFTVSGTQRQGLAFVCRIDGRPGADESMTVDGRAGYREQCVDTPPPGAYWSYWYAGADGAWTYAATGPSGHSAIAGGFEGWRFELNRSQRKPLPPSSLVAVMAPVTGTPSAGASPFTSPSAAGTGASSTPGEGSPWATVVALGGVVVLAGGGGVIAWRRSRAT